MFLQTITKGNKVAIDVLGQVASVGLILSQAAETKTEAVEHMKRIKISAEIVSTSSRDNITLFRDIPLFQMMAMVNLGTAFVQQKTEGGRDLVFCNVPICMDGALQSDKTKYVRFTVDATAANLSAGSVVHAYMLGSITAGTEPIRVVENRFRPKESTHISLAGATTIMYEYGLIDEARYKSVIGTELKVTDVEYPFIANTLSDLFIATADINSDTRVISGHNVMPCQSFVNVEIEASEADVIPVYVFYNRYSNSQIEGCNC